MGDERVGRVALGQQRDGDVAGETPSHLCAVSCRWRPQDKRMLLRIRSHPLTLGQLLPTLPLWLAGKLAVPLDLEKSDEQTCHDLWLT
jgi:hypothetical protein